MSIRQIQNGLLGDIIQQKMFSKAGINSQKKLRLSCENYKKPVTPPEYYKVKYRSQKRSRENDDSDWDNSTNEAEGEQENEDKKVAKTSPEKKDKKDASGGYNNQYTQVQYKIPEKEVQSTKKYKFSSTEREPTFLYTRSPFTYLNDKIKDYKQIRKIEKDVEKVRILSLTDLLISFSHLLRNKKNVRK